MNACPAEKDTSNLPDLFKHLQPDRFPVSGKGCPLLFGENQERRKEMEALGKEEETFRTRMFVPFEVWEPFHSTVPPHPAIGCRGPEAEYGGIKRGPDFTV